MEARVHILVLGVLAVYTTVLVLLVMRNVHSMRTQHACTDVSVPLCRTVSSILDFTDSTSNIASKHTEAVFAAVRDARFHNVRVLVFDPLGDVLLDTHGFYKPGKTTPPNDMQRDVRDAFEVMSGGKSGRRDDTNAGAAFPTSTTMLLHRPNGSKMAHVAGARCRDGRLVLTEATAT